MPIESILILVLFVFPFVLFGVVLAWADFYTSRRRPSAGEAPSNREPAPPIEQRRAA
jgi:hypothetical protein